MDKMLKINEVSDAAGCGYSKLYQMMRAGEFPSGVLLGRRTRRWPASQVAAWLESKKKESGNA